jgi:hypothetical protein
MMTLDTVVYDVALDAFNAITPTDQAPLVNLGTCTVTLSKLSPLEHDASVTAFLGVPEVQASIKTTIAQCAEGIFADGVVTIGDVGILMATVTELADTVNRLQHKQLGYAEITKSSIVPLIECLTMLLIQMLLPEPFLSVAACAVAQSIKLLRTDVAPRARAREPLFCCLIR